MKKTLAIILTLVMIFGTVAFSTSAEEVSTEPTVSIVTNKGSAVGIGTTTYFTVKFENFASIKGVDVTITADEAITLGDVDSYGFKGDATTAEGVNYTETNKTGEPHVIRFVDLTASEDARITFEATVNVETQTDPVINVTGKYAIDGKTFFDEDLPANGTFELTKKINAVVQEQAVVTPAVTLQDKTFTPAGGVYYLEDGEYKYVDKNDDGSFNIPQGATVQTFNVPENKIATFGASDDLNDSTALRFGNYSQRYQSGVEHGTVIFEGAWIALKNYYIQKGYTVEEIVPAVYASVLRTLAKPENTGKTFVTYTVNNQKVNVYIFQQKNYMWKDDANGILEYTLRLRGTKPGLTYTAAAFAKEGETVTFTADVKSVTKK